MSRKTDFEKGIEDSINSHDCNTERGEGRWMATGDGRETIKDRSDDD